MLRILYPIHIDRWTHPIATLLREVATRTPAMHFYTFSSPVTAEDRVYGQTFWELPQVQRITAADLLWRRFDIVHHASATSANLGAALVARLRAGGRCQHLFTSSTQPYPPDRFYRHYLLALKAANYRVAVSQTAADAIRELLYHEIDKVIPNGVDLAFYSLAASKVPAPVQGEAGFQQPYLLFVGVLTQSKRPDLFLELAQRLTGFDFVMAGRYASEEEQQRYAPTIAALPNVYHLGQQPRAVIRDLMAGAVALVFPSELEGLPFTVIEAGAMGLPVLAQPRSSLPEVVRDGETGWLLPGDDVGVWEQKIKQIAGWSAVERVAFAERSRGFVVARYSWEQVAYQYQQLYLSIAEQHHIGWQR